MTVSSITTKKRIEWIDISKGIVIILVVYGHCGLTNVPYLGDMVCTFHMPFFFLCSGLLFNYAKYPQLNIFVFRRWKTLVRPFFIFSVLVLALEACIQDNYIQFIFNILKKGWGGYSLWFIPVLFCTELYYWAICMISKGNKMMITVLILVSSAFGFVSSSMAWPNNYNLCFVLTAVLFYGFGNLIAPLFIGFFKEARNMHIFALGIVTSLFMLTFLLSKGKPEYFINHLVDIFTYTSAIGGALSMCVFAYVLSRRREKYAEAFKYAIRFFGRNSYIVLAFHQIILLLLAHYSNLPGTISRILMWGILTILILSINRYCPFILGKDKQA